jgi:hypothetical protein
MWFSWVVNSDEYTIDDPDFTKNWCKEQGFKLNPWVAKTDDLKGNAGH